ncbi:MAG: hypothetical protein V1846_02425 [Candidatus Komeilibacteria bacterium]
MSKIKKIQELEDYIRRQELELKKMKVVLGEMMGQGSTQAVDYAVKAQEVGRESSNDDGKIIEGVFDGQNMIGPDGKVYSVPANYASKSKLVEGDILKLTIDGQGNFIYKQIGPVERRRLMGVLARDQDKGDYIVVVDDRLFKTLTASITYYKGEEGDQVVILVPKDADSKWAAVENIIKKSLFPTSQS